MNYPSESHRNYIKRLKDICLKENLSLILKGSLAKNTATIYSDIDVLIIGEVTKELVDEIVISYGEPVMSNYTENPKGILILVYKDGLAIDLEFRYSVTNDELSESIVLVNSSKNIQITNISNLREVKSNYLPKREQWYKDLRLGHRALIKYLSKKEVDAEELLHEMKDAFSFFSLEYSGIFSDDISNLLDEIFDKYSIGEAYKKVLEDLVKDLYEER